jgi:hypothetical protein
VGIIEQGVLGKVRHDRVQVLALEGAEKLTDKVLSKGRHEM